MYVRRSTRFVENIERVESTDDRSIERRPRRMPGDERRRSLVLAAYELIADKGFEELRTRDVAARAGVNIATLHYYFGSKEDLIEGVVDYLLSLLSSEALRNSNLDYSSPLGQLRAMFLNTQYRLQTMPE